MTTTGVAGAATGWGDDMPTDDIATLAIYSDHLSAAAVTAALGVEPTSIHEIGDTRRRSRSRRAGSHSPTQYTHSLWEHTVRADPARSGVADAAGSTSIRLLVDVFREKQGQLETLRADYELRIWWSAISSSTQAPFVFDADLVRGLAIIGCDLYGTAYLEADGIDAVL